jgi:hypothetical protein
MGVCIAGCPRCAIAGGSCVRRCICNENKSRFSSDESELGFGIPMPIFVQVSTVFFACQCGVCQPFYMCGQIHTFNMDYLHSHTHLIHNSCTPIIMKPDVPGPQINSRNHDEKKRKIKWEMGWGDMVNSTICKIFFFSKS